MSEDDKPIPLHPGDGFESRYGGIRSRPPTPAYHKGWDRVFGKRKPVPKPRVRRPRGQRGG